MDATMRGGTTQSTLRGQNKIQKQGQGNGYHRKVTKKEEILGSQTDVTRHSRPASRGIDINNIASMGAYIEHPCYQAQYTSDNSG